MHVIDISEFEEQFVIHFGGEPKRINAYTLASTLVSIADSVKAANGLINPGYDVEVVVEAFGPGSFKVKIRTLYKGLSNLFNKQDLKVIVLGVIATFVYQHTLAPDSQVKIEVTEKEVIIEQGNNQVIVPREVHECVKTVEKSEKFKQSISRTFDVVARDTEVQSLGFSPRMDDQGPLVEIPRSRFTLLADEQDEDDDTRIVIEAADLQILRAILERNRRKWEFVWRGIKIPAPVLDQHFYTNFFAHKITIAPGDFLKVKMKIYQRKDGDTGIFTNHKYEVIEVIRHIPRLKQTNLYIK